MFIISVLNCFQFYMMVGERYLNMFKRKGIEIFGTANMYLQFLKSDVADEVHTALALRWEIHATLNG